MSGPGRIFVYNQDNHKVTATLFNFDIARHELKREHSEWLERNVVPLLRSGGSVTAIGLASPSGPESFNKPLSRRRIDAVMAFLRNKSPNNFKVAFDLAAGEEWARALGIRDGTEDETWRAVALSAWHRPAPPPPPPPPPPQPVAQVQRVVYRYFSKNSQSYSNGQKPDAIKEGIKALGELIKMKLSGELGRLVKGGENLGSRRYMNVDQRHRVNQVDIRYTWEYDIGWNHEIESHLFELEYRWGVPLAHLTVFYYDMGGGLRKVRDPAPLKQVIHIVRNEAEKDPFLSPISLGP